MKNAAATGAGKSVAHGNTFSVLAPEGDDEDMAFVEFDGTLKVEPMEPKLPKGASLEPKLPKCVSLEPKLPKCASLELQMLAAAAKGLVATCAAVALVRRGRLAGGRCLVIALWPGRCSGLLPTCVYRCEAFFVIWRDKLSGWSALCLDGIRGNCCLVRDGIRWNMFWHDAKM